MDQINNNPTSSKTDRKITERNRRNQMKSLYSTLNSLLPHNSSREATSVIDGLDEAVNYIKRLQINLERLKEKKNSLIFQQKNEADIWRLPQVEICEMGTTLKIVLKTGLDCRFIFSDILRLLQEVEELEILSASFSVLEDTVLHSIHSKIADSETKPEGFSRISEMVKQIVHFAHPF